MTAEDIFCMPHTKKNNSDTDRVFSPSFHHPFQKSFGFVNKNMQEKNVHGYPNSITDSNMQTFDYSLPHGLQKRPSGYSTHPLKKTQISDLYPERSVTPDITRGLISKQYNTNSMDRKFANNTDLKTNMCQPQFYQHYHVQRLDQNLGIPVQMPEIPSMPKQVPSSNVIHSYEKLQYSPNNIHDTNKLNYASINYGNMASPLGPYKYQEHYINDSLKISPIDPRNAGTFHSSTPSKRPELNAAINLENKMLSPKKSTMSNEELYAIIHKSKKKMNIQTEDIDRCSSSLSASSLTPCSSENSLNKISMKSPESGYIGDRARSRLSWSPASGEYVDYNTNIDRGLLSSEGKSRLSWACSDRKGAPQTSRMDFKKLLLQHGKSGLVGGPTRKVSAVEQLKLSKQQAQNLQSQSEISILDLSGSPRTFGNRKFSGNVSSPPKGNSDRNHSTPKLLSPRSQWKFANPRSDVLSSTILEDCTEDETQSSVGDNKSSKHQFINSRNYVASNNSMAASEIQSSTRRQIISEDISKYDKNTVSLTVAQKLQAQRAQFFNITPQNSLAFNKFHDIGDDGTKKQKSSSPPALETAF